MATNGVNSTEDSDMATCDGDKVVTMMDVLQEQEEFEEDANAVLGASDDQNCTYVKGYVKRQAVYACLTCCTGAKTDESKRAGVCLACSLHCHENHELVELYTKRNFKCDCGNPKFNSSCQFTPNKCDLNYENKYNQNFIGLYCSCRRPYPDPQATDEEEMIQCIVCEDWLHSNHLEATVPLNDQYAEMICKTCMEEYDFLQDYAHFAINLKDKEIVKNDLDFDIDVCSFKPMRGSKETVNSEVKIGAIALISEEKTVTPSQEFDEIIEEVANASKSEEDVLLTNAANEKKIDMESLDKNENETSLNSEDDHKNEAEKNVSIEKHVEINDINCDISYDVVSKSEANEKGNENSIIQDIGDKDITNENKVSEIKDSTIVQEFFDTGNDNDKNKNESKLEKESLEERDSSSTIESFKAVSENDNNETIDKTSVDKETINDRDASKVTDECDSEKLQQEMDMKSMNNQSENDSEYKETVSISEVNDGVNSDNDKLSEIENDIQNQEKFEEDRLLEDDTETKDKENGICDANSCENNGEMLEISSNNDNKTHESNDATVNKTEVKSDNANEQIESTSDLANNKPDVEMKDNTIKDLPDENSGEGQSTDKRKHEDDRDDFMTKKQKIECVRPRGVKKMFRGATFWPSNFRQKLCTCNECLSMYKDLAVLFLIDQDDTVTAYEALGKEKTNGAPSTQYEKGLQALSSLDRVQQINALTEYNKMRDKLLDFLKSFKDRKEIVKEEDIKAFFAGMKPKREPDGVYFCR